MVSNIYSPVKYHLKQLCLGDRSLAEPSETLFWGDAESIWVEEEDLWGSPWRKLLIIGDKNESTFIWEEAIAVICWGYNYNKEIAEQVNNKTNLRHDATRKGD